MIYTVDHLTRYKYSSPVFLEPHTIHLTPASNGIQQLLQFKLEITPRPSGQTPTVDSEGNPEVRCWFEDLTSELRVHTRSLVSTHRSDPFAYLFSGEDALPYAYAEEPAPALDAYLKFSGVEEVRRLAESVARECNYRALAFLPALALNIHQRCLQVYRADGPPLEPAQTLWRQEGSCRDLAVVFIDACRSVGLAARFVSGYLAADQADRTDLHAWAEVYVEGGGWRGFDPSSGLAVSDKHIVLAASASAAGAAAIAGSVRGSATADLTTSVEIQTDLRFGRRGAVSNRFHATSHPPRRLPFLSES
jgi:transglutaminase-like putative cysteine protease